MENQHRKINGYRELSQAEIDLMNEIKALGPQIEAVCNQVKEHIEAQSDGAKDEELERLALADPRHWEYWGRTTGQTVLMYLTRAVAQPTFY